MNRKNCEGFFLQALQQEKAEIFSTHFNETAAASTITVSPHADSIVMISIVNQRKIPEFSRHYTAKKY